MDPAFFAGVKKLLGVGEEQKELVDPYFLFTFAGKQVQSKIMYNNDHPEFNQVLRLGLQVYSWFWSKVFMSPRGLRGRGKPVKPSNDFSAITVIRSSYIF